MNHGKNKTKNYNFLMIDREVVFVTDQNKKNHPSPLGLSLEALGLYTVLVAHAIDKDFVFPSIKTLCKLTGKTKHTIIKYTNELIEKGLITKNKVRQENNGYDNNEYEICEVDKAGLTASVNFAQGSKKTEKKCTCPSAKNAPTHVENLHSKETNINDKKIKIMAVDFVKTLNIEITDSSYSHLMRACTSLTADNCSIKFDGEQILLSGSELANIAVPEIRKFLFCNDIDYPIKVSP